jgi:hypothetical protein
MKTHVSDGSVRTPIDCRHMVEAVKRQVGDFFGTLTLTGVRVNDQDSFTAEISGHRQRFVSIAPTIWEAGQNLRRLYNDTLQALMTETLGSLEGDGPCTDQLL